MVEWLIAAECRGCFRYEVVAQLQSVQANYAKVQLKKNSRFGVPIERHPDQSASLTFLRSWRHSFVPQVI